MLKEFFDNIKKNSTIAIYAAGIHGIAFKNYIEKNRPDIKILCFFDAYKDGKIDGYEIKSLKELPANKDLFDLLVVATRRSAHELNEIFNYYQIPYIRMSRKLEMYIRLLKYTESQKAASEIFANKEDKNLYNMIWSVRCGEKYDILEQYALENHNISKYNIVRNYRKHYLEYINKNDIKIIFDAGFCNGIHSLAFKKELKNLQKIYAFEPMYEKFKDVNFDYFLQKENFVKIIPLGLWSDSREIEFCENTAAKEGSRILGTKIGNELRKTEVVVKIHTTTIDEAKQKENIEKVDFIKMDIEGSELPALKGGLKTIQQDRPQLAVSIYHSNDDFVDIPLFLHENLKDYTFRLGHYSFDLCETVLYAIPNELL